MALPEEFHGPHPGTRRVNCETLSWHQTNGRVDRIRITAHTCECLATIFELCHAGGLGFVRKTVRREDQAVVRESDWLNIPSAHGLFLRILLGEAR
ncbi:hypothetical protein [Planotetraspora kaengkrachanensis]|uniref:Uncharacterized protein n=1 Tax=Planotetraspora kaengkrachanensis TaxID=575193 RepID=A0A8J3PW00_9ACTN|nr:hypothetical protein [Planotetraspora kaengkrachanensis]GIG82095.1 hypothetical protein Pka01_52220 [Planotetraspora kaengkrachanensis]